MANIQSSSSIEFKRALVRLYEQSVQEGSPEHQQIKDLQRDMNASSGAYVSAVRQIIPDSFEERAKSLVDANPDGVEDTILNMYMRGESVEKIAKARPEDTWIDPQSGSTISYSDKDNTVLYNNSTEAPSGGGSNFGSYSMSGLEASEAYKNLSEDDQKAVRSVFEAVASNDAAKAARFIKAFETATEINDPYFSQQVRMTVDAIRRGYTKIEDQEEYEAEQLANRLSDLREDVSSRKEYLSLEEQAALRAIERDYEQTLENTRQSLAAKGKTFSTTRGKAESLLNETTGDLRESTTRQFGMQDLNADRTLERGERDIESEVERLKQLSDDKKLDLFRTAEEQLGTGNLDKLPDLTDDFDPVGDIYGQIPQEKLQDTLNSASSLTF